jgi:hypothetical protein
MTEPTAYLDYDSMVRLSVEIHGTVPHCDSNILHRLGTCDYCDERLELHSARRVLCINYTGEYEEALLICPSERDRPLETIERWGGNRRTTDERGHGW